MSEPEKQTVKIPFITFIGDVIQITEGPQAGILLQVVEVREEARSVIAIQSVEGLGIRRYTATEGTFERIGCAKMVPA